jgi:biofilm PGA synthesis N-glycosyltransferase PgaC
LLRREKDQNRRFASKVFALRAGLQMLGLEATQFIGHLDADISLDSTYFSDLLINFLEDPELGIAGGWCFEMMRDGLRQCRGSSPTSVFGAIQMFRRECYQDIGGLLPIEYGGEDWYAEIRARMCGWRVRSFSELQVRHRRATGTAGSSLRYCYGQGFMDFAVGSHPVFQLAKLARRILWRPYFLGALARLLGFLMAYIVGKRMVPPEFVAYLREEQMERLWFTFQ